MGESSAEIRPSKSAAHDVAVVAAVAVAALGVYLGLGAWLAADANLLAHSSGIYDMDVARVVVDLTQDAPGHRASAHPLQKLWLAPLGRALNSLFFEGRSGLRAAQVLVALAAALGAFGAGWLALQLSGGSRGAGVAACALTGASFTSLLAGSVPESAVFAGLTSLAPLIWRELRRGLAFSGREAAVWAALAVLGLGLTVTQVLVVGIAALLRIREAARGDSARRVWRRAGVALGAAVVLTAALVELQHRIEHDTPRFYAENPIANESPFLRETALAATPFRHVGRLAWHFLAVDFVAPLPAKSDFLIRDYGIRSWSLSAEEAGLDAWHPVQRALVGVWSVGLVAVVLLGRWRDPRLLAPALVLGFHFALHLVYGREYVLYAPHWHGVLTATLVAAVWNAAPARRGGLALAAAALSLALLANSAFVMAAVRREVGWGLGADVRDARGRALADPDEIR